MLVTKKIVFYNKFLITEAPWQTCTVLLLDYRWCTCLKTGRNLNLFKQRRKKLKIAKVKKHMNSSYGVSFRKPYLLTKLKQRRGLSKKRKGQQKMEKYRKNFKNLIMNLKSRKQKKKIRMQMIALVEEMKAQRMNKNGKCQLLLNRLRRGGIMLMKNREIELIGVMI